MILTGIIPARFASTRFPGKPLAEINGKPLIRMVYEQASISLDSLYVATDDERIAKVVSSFGGEVIMTSSDCRSGTDRCAEALRYLIDRKKYSPDIIINIQGDEPFIKPEQINQLCNCFNDNSVKIATLIREIDNINDLEDNNKPKVVFSDSFDALYFSRSVIPFVRDVSKESWLSEHKFYKHIGMYGYTADTLLDICELEPSTLEIAESLEQNRWLQNGIKIRTAITKWESIGIDTPEDLENAKIMLNGL
ncbi:MAG: 3-deoxy-manno-octulosonate cytidylyltransferase [Bacteroidales bacterium]|nr:3-deoxy-manno-octulosonate cytidylyltransferase [Bacteroidales bacterium]